jgi:tetratricopeptide (TPR) repeat protein
VSAGAADRTRRSGEGGTTQEADQGFASALAARALDLVGSDPAAAVTTAKSALVFERSSRSAAVRTTAYRALGLAAQERGDLSRARDLLRRATRSASAAGDLTSAAEARMSLSFVLIGLGLTRQALKQAALAADVLEGLPRWRLEAQRALVLQRCGRLAEAWSLYAEVIPELQRAGDQAWEAKARCNRGLLNMLRGQTKDAETDLIAARDLHHSVGRSLDAAIVVWNLGCLARDRGDFVSALEKFDESDTVCDKYHHNRGLRLMDRAALMLSVGVCDEARELAEAARREFTAMRQMIELAESEILLAQIDLADHDFPNAISHSQAARRLARGQRRPAWALRAKYLELLAISSSSVSVRGACQRAERVASDLQKAHWEEAAVEARLVAAQLALNQGLTRRASTIMGEARSGLGRNSAPGVVVRKWYVEARICEQRGEYVGATRAVRSGLNVLARHRAGLGASDVQAHIPVLGEDLARVGLRLALRGGQAATVLREIERWRGQDLRSRPVRPPRDSEMLVAVGNLRRATSDLRSSDLDAVRGRRLRSSVATFEREVLRLSRRTRNPGWRPAPPPPKVGALKAVLADRVFVEFIVIEGELVAVVLPGDDIGPRGPGLYRLGPIAPAADSLAFLQFALFRMAPGVGSERTLRAAMSGALESARRLDSLLLSPLRSQLGDAPLVIAPTESLHAVPWGVLPTSSRVPVHVVRSGGAWLAATAHHDRASSSAARVFITGPDVRPAPRPSTVDDSTWAAGARATVPRALQMMEGSAVAHIAAHGLFRESNPLFSSLRLSNGDLTIYDLEGLGEPPKCVVLAACHSASSKVLPGNQLLGFTHALLAQGSAGVIATSLPTPDLDTEKLMAALHGGMTDFTDPAGALLSARGVLDLTSPSGYATSAGFDMYGR